MSVEAQTLGQQMWAYAVSRPGSTRLPAIMRILLALTVWGKFAVMFRPRVDAPVLHMVLMVVFWVATPMMLVGFKSRAATFATGAALFVGFYALGAYGPYRDAWVHHHTYILAAGVILLATTPCGRSLSVDRWLAVRRGDALPERGELWGLNLIGLQVACSYGFSAWDKSRWAFISGAELERTFAKLYLGSDPVEVPGYLALMTVLAVTTVFLEYTWPITLWFSATRRFMLPVALGFHLIIYIALPVSTFSFTMAVLLLAFTDADTWHEQLDNLLSEGGPQVRADASAPTAA